MSSAKKATDEQIMAAYEETKSIWKSAEKLGMCGQSVHERLQKLGVDTSQNVFTKEDERYLSERYVLYRDAGQLQTLADEMGRTKQFICRQAGKLGLTDPKCSRKYLRKWDVPDSVILPIWNDFKKSRYGVTAYCKNKHYNIQSFVDAMRRCFPDEYDSVIASKKPKSAQYRRGRDFEYMVLKDMMKHGYFALRSPASKSPVDIYCIAKGELVFIQCKLHGALGVGEWNSFLDFCESLNATPIMAEKLPRGIGYHRITDRKDGTKKSQPMVDWQPNDIKGEYVKYATCPIEELKNIEIK